VRSLKADVKYCNTYCRECVAQVTGQVTKEITDNTNTISEGLKKIICTQETLQSQVAELQAVHKITVTNMETSIMTKFQELSAAQEKKDGEFERIFYEMHDKQTRLLKEEISAMGNRLRELVESKGTTTATYHKEESQLNSSFDDIFNIDGFSGKGRKRVLEE